MSEAIDLGSLTRRLALGIQNYPKTDRENVMRLASELDNNVPLGQKQQWKDTLIETLGYDMGGNKIYGSLQRIPENIMFLTDLGVQDMGRVVTRFPNVFSVDVKKIKSRVEYLMSIGIKEEDIGRVVTRFPSVLSLDVENNLKPTYRFLQYNFGVTAEDIVKCPSLLSYSLKNRIKPRFEFLRTKGLEKRYNASTVLTKTDEIFCRLLKVPLHEYQGFREQYLKRAT